MSDWLESDFRLTDFPSATDVATGPVVAALLGNSGINATWSCGDLIVTDMSTASALAAHAATVPGWTVSTDSAGYAILAHPVNSFRIAWKQGDTGQLAWYRP